MLLRAGASWLVAFGLLLAAGVLPVAGVAAAEQTGRVFVPQPPRGQGERCVADTDFMRRNHMKLLVHQRDGTVHQGLRTPTYSLSGCIGCHAVKGADGKAVSYASPQHFCRTCHIYAAVSVDCFECHASRPEERAKAAAAEQDTAALADFLRGKAP